MNPRNPVILCVDDEEANLKLLANILVPQGYTVVSAASGKDALLKIKCQTIDIVLLDIIMPGMDGFEVCRQIKEDQKLRNIPVIMITVLTDKQDRIRGIEAGAEEFLSKPFDQTEALARIKILLKVKELNDARACAEEALQKSHDELDRQVQERTAELAQANTILQADITERKRMEAEREKLLQDLGKRLKELGCIADISRLAEKPWVSIEEFVQGAVNILPPAWQYPEICCARIMLDSKEFKTANFRKTEWSQVADINVDRKKFGAVTICYLEEKPAADEGPFLKEERILINTVADFLGHVIQHRLTEAEIMASEEKFRMIFDNANDGILLADTESKKFHFANVTICHMLGYSQEEIKNMGVMDIHPEKDIPYIIEQFEKQIRKEIEVAQDLPMKRKDGSVFYADVNSSPVEIEGKRYLLGIFRDITERKQAEEMIKKQLMHITALRNIDMAITGSIDLRVTLQIFLDETMRQIHVDAANVLLFKPHTNTLEYVAGRGFYSDALKHTKLLLGEGYAGRAALEKRTISVQNLSKDINTLSRSSLLAREGFMSYCAAPLIAKGSIKGVLEVFHRTPFEADVNWLDFLEGLATQAAIAIDNATLFEDLQRSNIDLSMAYDATLEGWSKALDLRDKETEGHSQRVTDMSVKIAHAMGISDSELVHVRRGALLHDIGKMGIPDHILLKPGPLNDEEWEIMHKHPVYAYELLSPITFLRPALDIPYYHHEKWDGTGYPRGLKGEQIPLSARIFALVDVWDALNSDRPYRPAWPEEKIRKYLLEQVGKHFDPKVFEVFLKLYSELKP
ncbi:MAG: hypothetical protein A2Y66_04170 [Nitrospirae bacterium RBG_13_41_22]|nr:MAG: hypothetical protein A2Y66_04170 [Nitrospirae bacterium RBG_13_41_22]